MTVNWTQEPARETKPQNPHNTLAWTLWVLSIAVVITWGILLAFGITWGGRVYGLLILFALLTLVHIYLGFRNVTYFVPLRLTGSWFLRWGRGRVKTTTPILPAPRTAFDSGTMKDETNQPIVTSDTTILPGNDPQSGPGQRQPNAEV